LDAVATVVDAEAAHVALAQPTGLAQLAAADLIVINKADLVGLRAMSDLEDRIAALAPHIRMVRTRFGQLPLEAVMDVAQVAPAGATTTTEVPPPLPPP
jgi:G3E family GTPase